MGYGAHIESFRKISSVNTAWEQINTKYPDFLAGFSKNIRHIDLGEKGVFNRLIIGNFKNKITVDNFCKQLLILGQPYCMPMML